jgi:glyoxylase-like metal-dependent hydrolase (beta-lactamase superfamily II)
MTGLFKLTDFRKTEQAGRWIPAFAGTTVKQFAALRRTMVEFKAERTNYLIFIKEPQVILQKLELGSFASNCYIVGDENSKDGIIIDPGDEGATIMKQVKALGLKIKVIVLTHSHIDHIGGLAEVKKATGAEIAIHESEAPFLLKQPWRLDFMPPTPPAPPADRLLKDGDVITVGKLKFKVLHTPGHTKGGICLLGDGIVFSGDTLFNYSVGRADFPGSDYDQEMSSIRSKLMTLPDAAKVYPGHGPATTIGIERKGNPFINGTAF